MKHCVGTLAEMLNWIKNKKLHTEEAYLIIYLNNTYIGENLMFCFFFVKL